MDFNKGIKEIEIEGERVFLKKSFLGYGVVHPIKIDNKINWKNLLAGGSWIKLILIIVFVLILIGTIFEIRNIYEIASKCLQANPIIWKN